MGEHRWGPTTLNHGVLQCTKCGCTEREAAFALGMECSVNDAPMRGRDVQAAARRLAMADDAELQTILTHDPDMIRDVAAEAVQPVWKRPVWKQHADNCARMDSGDGPCTCGAEDAARAEAEQYKGRLRSPRQ